MEHLRPAVWKNLEDCARSSASAPRIGAAQCTDPDVVVWCTSMQALLRTCTARGIEWMDPELYGDSWTPLHAAAVAGREDVAACLLLLRFRLQA